MALAIFDLDNTLLAGDSDHRWGEFLCEKGLAEAADFRARNDQFYADYQAGTLDMRAYLDFVLAPLAGKTRAEVRALQRQFIADCVEPMLLDKAFRSAKRAPRGRRHTPHDDSDACRGRGTSRRAAWLSVLAGERRGVIGGSLHGSCRGYALLSGRKGHPFSAVATSTPGSGAARAHLVLFGLTQRPAVVDECGASRRRGPRPDTACTCRISRLGRDVAARLKNRKHNRSSRRLAERLLHEPPFHP